jgi:hypothetical protein
MVYAILSDVHGNLPALAAAIDLLPPMPSSFVSAT